MCELCGGEHSSASHRIRVEDLHKYLKIGVVVESTGVPFSAEKRVTATLYFNDVNISQDSSIIEGA